MDRVNKDMMQSRIILNQPTRIQVVRNLPVFGIGSIVYGNNISNHNDNNIQIINTINSNHQLIQLRDNIQNITRIENSNNYEYLLPSLLHNIVTLFLKYDPNNDGFGNYYLVEIIKKTKETHYTFWKDFLSLSIEIYIEKKDHNKLKAVLSELEIYYEDNPTIPKSCLYFYAKIILIISEGNKWNAVNKIQQLCLQMN